MSAQDLLSTEQQAFDQSQSASSNAAALSLSGRGVSSHGFFHVDALWRLNEAGSGNQDCDTSHCTQKPVECMRRPLQNTSSPGQAVYDPFLGSGTTVVAAETTHRVCLAMELEPAFVHVAVRRWEAFTGKKATPR